MGTVGFRHADGALQIAETEGEQHQQEAARLSQSVAQLTRQLAETRALLQDERQRTQVWQSCSS